MIKFKEPIFFGREDCLEKCYLLHKRLEEAFNIMSGLQQPDHSDNEKIAKELGMEPDEVLRLSQIAGLAEMFASQEFSMAWEMESEDE